MNYFRTISIIMITHFTSLISDVLFSGLFIISIINKQTNNKQF